jgi:hypothetical protein
MINDLLGVGLVAVTLLLPHGIAKLGKAAGEKVSAQYSQGMLMGQLYGVGSGYLIYKLYLEY